MQRFFTVFHKLLKMDNKEREDALDNAIKEVLDYHDVSREELIDKDVQSKVKQFKQSKTDIEATLLYLEIEEHLRKKLHDRYKKEEDKRELQ